MDEEEREGRRVRCQEAIARKGGLGDEDRDDGWMFHCRCCWRGRRHGRSRRQVCVFGRECGDGCGDGSWWWWWWLVACRVEVSRKKRRAEKERRRVRCGCGCRRCCQGGVSVHGALQLAQVRGAHLPLFSFALREDAQSAPVRHVRVPGRL